MDIAPDSTVLVGIVTSTIGLGIEPWTAFKFCLGVAMGTDPGTELSIFTTKDVYFASFSVRSFAVSALTFVWLTRRDVVGIL